MERKELFLRERIRRLLEIFTFEQILEHNDITEEDALLFLYFEYGLQFPEEPL